MSLFEVKVSLSDGWWQKVSLLKITIISKILIFFPKVTFVTLFFHLCLPVRFLDWKLIFFSRWLNFKKNCRGRQRWKKSVTNVIFGKKLQNHTYYRDFELWHFLSQTVTKWHFHLKSDTFSKLPNIRFLEWKVKFFRDG